MYVEQMNERMSECIPAHLLNEGMNSQSPYLVARLWLPAHLATASKGSYSHRPPPGVSCWVPLGLPLGKKRPLVKLQCKFKQIEIAWIQMTYSNQLARTTPPPPRKLEMISPP